MKKILMTLCLAMTTVVCAAGKTEADSIIGIYSVSHQGEESKVSINKEADGTYSAKVIWVKDRYDGNGKLKTDVKNPDKSRRDTPCDRIVLIENMKYNEKKACWSDARIYDPVRGIKANVSCSFEKPGVLKVRGSLMGFGETVYWTKVE